MTNSKKKTVLWELVHSGEASRQTKIKTTSINNILQKSNSNYRELKFL